MYPALGESMEAPRRPLLKGACILKPPGSEALSEVGTLHDAEQLETVGSGKKQYRAGPHLLLRSVGRMLNASSSIACSAAFEKSSSCFVGERHLQWRQRCLVSFHCGSLPRC